jgi:exosortase/archaeosortase family protein
VILLEHGKIAVVEACNGLSMLLTFAAMTTGMAMIISRPWLDRLILVLSTIPVALAVNILRITANGVAIEIWDVERAHEWFHDQGGWLMMPVALTMLWIELWLLKRLLVEPSAVRPIPIVAPPAVRPRQPVAVAR